MTEIRTRAFVGFAGVVAAGFLTASLSSSGCGSSGGTAGTTGGAGTTGHAGTTGGGAGTTGHAGTSGGGAGTTGTGGGSACVAATTPLISDFTVDAGTGLLSGSPYTFQDTGLAVPTVSTSSGSLHATFNTGAPSTMYPYAGVGLPFAACTDVSAYTGVKFNISGTLSTGCTIQFSLGDRQHSSTGFGTCTGSCYPGAKVFPLPATATDVTVLFSQIGAGSPASPIVVPAEAVGIQWQLNVATGDAGGCTGDITIDNVTFL